MKSSSDYIKLKQLNKLRLRNNQTGLCVVLVPKAQKLSCNQASFQTFKREDSLEKHIHLKNYYRIEQKSMRR